MTSIISKSGYFYLFIEMVWLTVVFLIGGLILAERVSRNLPVYQSVAVIAINRDNDFNSVVEELRQYSHSFRDEIDPTITIKARPSSRLIEIVANHEKPESARDLMTEFLKRYKRLKESQIRDAFEERLKGFEKHLDAFNIARSGLEVYKRAILIRDEIAKSDKKIQLMIEKEAALWELNYEKRRRSALVDDFVNELQNITDNVQIERAFWKEKINAAGKMSAEAELIFQIKTLEERESILTAKKKLSHASIKRVSDEPIDERDFFEVLEKPELPKTPIPIVDRDLIFLKFGILGLVLGVLFSSVLGFWEVRSMRYSRSRLE